MDSQQQLQEELECLALNNESDVPGSMFGPIEGDWVGHQRICCCLRHGVVTALGQGTAECLYTSCGLAPEAPVNPAAWLIDGWCLLHDAVSACLCQHNQGQAAFRRTCKYLVFTRCMPHNALCRPPMQTQLKKLTT